MSQYFCTTRYIFYQENQFFKIYLSFKIFSPDLSDDILLRVDVGWISPVFLSSTTLRPHPPAVNILDSHPASV